ncbi:MAG: pilus assembly protein [Gemmatimonadetes bacterium]|nr:pilus assembly protein [Gemmatimonadota bacterium]
MLRLRWWRTGPVLRDERGQAAVELALILPVALLLVVGSLEFARVWNVYQVVTDAAREGARKAVVASPARSADSVRAVVRSALARASLDTTQAQITVSGVGDATGTPARVEIRYSYPLKMLKPLMGWGSEGKTLTLAASCVMRNE